MQPFLVGSVLVTVAAEPAAAEEAAHALISLDATKGRMLPCAHFERFTCWQPANTRRHAGFTLRLDWQRRLVEERGLGH